MRVLLLRQKISMQEQDSLTDAEKAAAQKQD